MLFLPIALGLLLLAAAPQVVRADIVGNTYYFSANWSDVTYQEDGGAIYQSSVDGEFKITVLNVTEVGGDDAYEYNYQGFNVFLSPFVVNHNDTSEFMENKVYFDLTTTDIDANNRSEATGITIHPSTSLGHPGRECFVSPVWSTHNLDWNSAVNDAEANLMVREITDSIGDGAFSFRIVVDTEGTDPDLGEMNGTLTFSFAASYDSDGILLNWENSRRSYMFNENHTMDHNIIQRFTRTTGVGPGGLDFGAGVPVIFVGVIALGTLVLGVVIGKRLL